MNRYKNNGAMHKIITDRMLALADDKEAAHLSRFFRTGKGQYGEGDRFLGIRVPETRKLVKEFRSDITLKDISELLSSQWHEIRLAGFLGLVCLYEKARKDDKTRKEIVDFYLANLHYGNNWDLVDLAAPKILGPWLLEHPEERGILYELASSDKSLWHNRVAVVTTWNFLCNGEYEDTFRLVKLLMSHPHDLIHKACGWMLREAGKRGGMKMLLEFLDRYASKMPRTMLRYAIEKFPEPDRLRYLAVKPQNND